MTRSPREHPLNTVVLILLVLFTLATSASARQRKSSDSEPGTFDYYLLSLSWSPAFCLSDPEASECNGPRRLGFIVHGLWPQYEKGWPENCNVHEQVPDNVISSISDIMPARRAYRDLSPRACSADAARGACRAATLIVPPIR
jgi:ribonuclease T2